MDIYFLSIGLILFILGLWFLIYRLYFFYTAEELGGVVIEKQKIRWRESGSGGYSKCLKIEYKNFDRTKAVFIEYNSLITPFYSKGDQVFLLRNKHKKEHILVRSFIVIFSAPILLLILSILAILISGYL